MQKQIKALLSPLGITTLTPIQQDALDNYIHYDEVILYAPTGSGKTLAFLLPLLELLSKQEATQGIQAIILSPTRELALQIESVFKSLKSEQSCTTCYGGHSIKTEVNNLSANPSVVIGTPGRISDHLNRRNISLKTTPFLIIDEFDKCLELGFQTEIEHIYGQLRNLQKSVYGSATRLDKFPPFIQLKNPVYLDQLIEDSAPDISYFSLPDHPSKPQQLARLIANFRHEPTIIFCNFREDVDGLADYFDANAITITSYHGGQEQDVRERSLIKFRNKSCPVLICTDLGSRGLDIPEVKHIIHFQLPEKEDAFIHRNGRTARMAANGNVYYFEEDKTTSSYPLPKAKPYTTNTDLTYFPPEWVTLYFSAGKKNKINKIDLLGFICQKGALSKEDVGMITVLDFASYVAVHTHQPNQLVKELNAHKVKGQKLRIAQSR